MEEEERKIVEVQFWLNFFLSILQSLTERDHGILSSFHHKTWKKNPHRVNRSATKREDLIMKKFLLANKSYRSTVNDMRNKRAFLIVVECGKAIVYSMKMKIFFSCLLNASSVLYSIVVMLILVVFISREKTCW
jgi:hypothetical protein